MLSARIYLNKGYKSKADHQNRPLFFIKPNHKLLTPIHSHTWAQEIIVYYNTPYSNITRILTDSPINRINMQIKYFNLNTFSLLNNSQVITILRTKNCQTILSNRKAYRKTPTKLRGKNTKTKQGRKSKKWICKHGQVSTSRIEQKASHSTAKV